MVAAPLAGPPAPPCAEAKTEHPPNAPVSILVTMTTARSLAARHKKRGARSRAVPPWKKAGNTDRWTEILFRALTAKVAKRWRFVSFRGNGGGEWCGVVDVLAIRKDTSRSNHRVLKSGDLFEMVLVQMKGGSAGSPEAADIHRLRAVKRRYRAEAIVLFAWKRGVSSHFFKLGRGEEWTRSSAKEIFG